MNTSTSKKPPLETHLMEQRLEQLKLAMKKEKETRRSGSRWQSTEPGAKEALRRATLNNANLMARNTNLKLNVLKEKIETRALPQFAQKTKALPRSSLTNNNKNATLSSTSSSTVSSVSSSTTNRSRISNNALRAGGLKKSPRKTGSEKTTNAILCEQCENTAASQRCIDCDLAYCSLCWRSFHSKGNLQSHHSAPLAWKQGAAAVVAEPQRSAPVGQNGCHRRVVQQQQQPPQIRFSDETTAIYPSQDESLNSAKGDGHCCSSSVVDGNPLKEGAYDEKESARSFQDALLAWRSSSPRRQDSAAAGASGRRSAESNTDETKVATSESSTNTVEQSPPKSVRSALQIRFSETTTLRYSEQLLLQRKRRLRVNGESETTITISPVSPQINNYVPEEEEETTTTNANAPTANTAKQGDVQAEGKGGDELPLNGLVDFFPYCKIASKAGRKNPAFEYVKYTALPPGAKTVKNGPTTKPAVNPDQTEDVILRSGGGGCDGIRCSLAESLLSKDRHVNDQDSDAAHVGSELEEMRANRHNRIVPIIIPPPEDVSGVTLNGRSPSPIVIVHPDQTYGDQLPHLNLRNNNNALPSIVTSSPGRQSSKLGMLRPTIEITPLFSRDPIVMVNGLRTLSPVEERLPGLTPHYALSLSPSSRSPSSVASSRSNSQSPSPHGGVASGRRSSRSRSPQNLSHSPQPWRVGNYTRRDMPAPDPKKTKVISTNAYRNMLKPPTEGTDSASVKTSARLRRNSYKDRTKSESLNGDGDTTMVVPKPILKRSTPLPPTKTKEPATTNSKEQKPKPKFSTYRLGPNIWNTAENMVSMVEVNDNIPCMDFGIRDYLTLEAAAVETEEESSIAGDFGTGLDVEPDSLNMDDGADTPVPTQPPSDADVDGFRKAGGLTEQLRRNAEDTVPKEKQAGPVVYASDTDSDDDIPADVLESSFVEREAEDEEMMASLERELSSGPAMSGIDETTAARLMRLNSQELSQMSQQQLDAALSIEEDFGVGSGLSTPESDDDDEVQMVKMLD